MTESTTTTGIGERDTSQVAREQGRQIKGTARDAASDVATTAGERTRDIREQAASHVRGIAAEARRQLRDRIEQETEHAGSALGRAGSQLKALTEGRADEAGVFSEYAEQAAQTVNRWADSIQDRGLDGLLDDLRSVGRRRPGAFLLGAMAAGMIAGRFGRNLRQEMSESSDRGPGDGSNALVSGPAAGPGQTADRYLTTERTAEVDVPVRSMP